MGWMAPTRHLGAKVLVGLQQRNTIRGQLTCGQRLHLAEADITKPRGGFGF